MNEEDLQTVLVTGAGGLIGSEAVKFFASKGYEVLGIDNNKRKEFFGKGGDVSKNLDFLLESFPTFSNHNLDIRDTVGVNLLVDFYQPDVIIHAAAQPSHDWAVRAPLEDFTINANGTLNLLEVFRNKISNPRKVFIHMSTNKVYGDNPNKVNLTEGDTRFDYSPNQTMLGVSLEGVNEEMSLDNCTHSLFGVSKASGDLLAQEYGRYFDLNVGVFRGGCLTGPQHSAVELHGFLAYIIDCAVNKKPYTIFGYDGKQVRDQIHSSDVISSFWEFIKKPKKGEAYNLGGCKQNAASVFEIVETLNRDFGLKLDYSYNPKNRVGDHICYYSDMSKFKSHFPEWKITKSLPEIIHEIIEAKK